MSGTAVGAGRARVEGWRAPILIALACGLSTGAAPAYGDTDPSWQYVREQDGIVSYRRERVGAPLSGFRARAGIAADVWTVLSILEDVDRGCEWTAHCAEMRKLHGSSERELLVYARMNAPWPVRDRDVVTRVSLTIQSLTEIIAEIRSVPGQAPPEDVVRIPSLQASYRFSVRGPQRVEVEYEIEVDPGGTLPDWLKNMVGRDLAHQTLFRLRDRVRWALREGAYAKRAARLEQIARARAQGAARAPQVALSERAP